MKNKFIILFIFLFINSLIAPFTLSDDNGSGSDNGSTDNAGDTNDVSWFRETFKIQNRDQRDAHREQVKENRYEMLQNAGYNPSGSWGGFFLDIVNGAYSASIGDRMIAGWLVENKMLPDWDITKNFDTEDGWWPYIFDTTYAITNKWLCNNKREGYYEESVYREVTRSGTLPLSTNNMIYIYGLKQKYEDSRGNSLAGLEKSWFINEENEPIGYLYTISWQFRNPYSSSDIEEMSSSDRNSKGLDSSGNLSLAIVLSNSQTSKQGMERKVSPSRSSGGTVSFYSLDDFDKVHIRFLNNYKHNGRNTFPNPNECRDNNIGCIKEIHFEGSMYGSTVNPEEFTSMATAQITEGDVASADSDTQEDCGDLGCVI